MKTIIHTNNGRYVGRIKNKNQHKITIIWLNLESAETFINDYALAFFDDSAYKYKTEKISKIAAIFKYPKLFI